MPTPLVHAPSPTSLHTIVPDSARVRWLPVTLVWPVALLAVTLYGYRVSSASPVTVRSVQPPVRLPAPDTTNVQVAGFPCDRGVPRRAAGDGDHGGELAGAG